MNEKYHFGFELLFRQKVYAYEIVKDKEQGDLIAIRREPLLREYDFFGERGIADKTAGILTDIVLTHEKKKESNKRRLFERFIQKWGFWDYTTTRLSMNDFWTEISKVAILLKRYSQVINGELEELKGWINVRKLEPLVSPEERLASLLDVAAVKKGYTHEVIDIEEKHNLQVKIESDALEKNPLPYYQFWGFSFTHWTVEEQIDWRPSSNKYRIEQKNFYLPIEDITPNPT